MSKIARPRRRRFPRTTGADLADHVLARPLEPNIDMWSRCPCTSRADSRGRRCRGHAAEHVRLVHEDHRRIGPARSRRYVRRLAVVADVLRCWRRISRPNRFEFESSPSRADRRAPSFAWTCEAGIVRRGSSCVELELSRRRRRRSARARIESSRNCDHDILDADALRRRTSPHLLAIDARTCRKRCGRLAPLGHFSETAEGTPALTIIGEFLVHRRIISQHPPPKSNSTDYPQFFETPTEPSRAPRGLKHVQHLPSSQDRLVPLSVSSSNSICRSPRSSRAQSRPRHLPCLTKSHLSPSAIA